MATENSGEPSMQWQSQGEFKMKVLSDKKNKNKTKGGKETLGSVRYVFYFDHSNGITGVTLQIVHINICSSLYISYTSTKL